MTDTTEPIAAEQAQIQYKDDDLVYVDPKERVVVGRVEFDEKDIPKPLAMKTAVEEADDEEEKPAKPGTKGRVRKPRVRYYPWGTYRSMKKIYKIEGKILSEPPTATLDEIMEKALQQPYWD